MQTERARPYPLYVEPLKSLPIVLISLFIVVAAVDALLALQPGLLQSLRAYWSTPPAGGTTSSALTAASLIVGGVAFSATVLAGFIRGVRSAPYLCITPVWVCACMLAIARVQTPLPLPVPTSAFVAISALLFVGSGVLFESTSRLSNLIGTAASLLPLTLLSIGYAFNADAQASFNGDSMLMLFVLALAGAGAPAIAVACRANGARVLGGQSTVPEAAGAQIVALLERARVSEERAARAELQLAAGGALQPHAANAPRLALDDEELALTKPRGGSAWFGWAAAAVVLALTVAWYAFGYAPLRGELANAEQASATQAEEHAAALARLRADFERKRTDLEQQLAAAAPAVAVPATAAPAPKAPRAVAVPQDSASDAADDDVSDASAERDARAQARREARLAKREQALAARAERVAEHEANAAAAKEAREAARQARVAEHEQKVAERQARAAEKAETRASEREAKASERAEARASEREAKTGEKVERSAAAAATAALEAQAYGADTGKSSKRSTEKAAPAAAPQKSAADVDNESSDDPLEGL